MLEQNDNFLLSMLFLLRASPVPWRDSYTTPKLLTA